ncbi:hypothetical protein N657DRAFT_355005 [Parathielavia appendiculata]|uniref:Uncharacterized protein n=1 Tax=Parathielavia appendiculata TaxID=2587402 RepID=A0AAN6Z4V4_9PEZI|nr:hypothetical protein N657DRAFT_355005 [Parathielavia appendiculata]
MQWLISVFPNQLQYDVPAARERGSIGWLRPPASAGGVRRVLGLSRWRRCQPGVPPQSVIACMTGVWCQTVVASQPLASEYRNSIIKIESWGCLDDARSCLCTSSESHDPGSVDEVLFLRGLPECSGRRAAEETSRPGPA